MRKDDQCQASASIAGRAEAEIGRTGLKVNRLGLGGAPLAGLYQGVTDEDAALVVNAYLGHGLGFFDTAPLYGSGVSETRLGTALSSRGRVSDAPARESFVLATKVGRLLVPDPSRDQDVWSDDLPPVGPVFDYSYDGTLRSLEESLVRLGLDRVDILHIHDPDNHYEEAMKGSYRALVRLRDEGVIRAIGVGMNQAKMLARFAAEGDFDCFLCAGRYTLVDHTALKRLLPLCEERNISIIIGGPYNSGILAQGAVDGAKFDYRKAPSHIVNKVRRIEAVCGRHGTPLKAAALQFPLAHPAVAAVIPGARSAGEVDENVRMFKVEIPADFWSELREEGLIPEEAPMPAAPASS
ncbi:MAG: aldo/keto reductase [candidate division Zixibacteria bacterium]|nr:aldo/keto reductase [candidate division Zixibacteria bacterium]